MGKCGSIKKCMFGDMCKPPYDIGGCSHYKEKRPQTNEGWLKQCTTEQLAEILFQEYCNGRNDATTGDWEGVDTYVEWLKQPHPNE